jgi:hypothetical protein
MAGVFVALAVGTARAQTSGNDLADLRVRLARAELQSAAIARADSIQRSTVRDQRLGQIITTATVPVIVWRSISQGLAELVAESASALIGTLGVIPRTALDSLVVVQASTSDIDALLALPQLRGRRMQVFNEEMFTDTSRVIWAVASATLTSWTSTLDTTWRAWSTDPRLGWSRDREGEWAQRALTGAADEVGKGCLAADLRDCRRWLGLDADEHPYRTRYRGSDIRRRLAQNFYWGDRQSWWLDAERCRDGGDDACIRLAERFGSLDPVPAPDIARSSLLQAVRALHGPDALRAALLKRTGSLGDRLAGASGIGVDSLVREWRNWTLSRGRVDRVRAGLGEMAMVILTVALMVFLATRSGRWR